MGNKNKIVSKNPIVIKILELNSMDMILSIKSHDNYKYIESEDLVRTGFHLLIASLCMSVVNLGISTGEPEIDEYVGYYRNSIIHLEGDFNLKELKFSLFEIVDVILNNFRLEQRNSNRIYSNVYPIKLDEEVNYGN